MRLAILMGLVLTGGPAVDFLPGGGKGIRLGTGAGSVSVPSNSAAMFEFAPASGTGMGLACACTTPTGARGEALTFSRASTAYCTKSNETTLIANGDLVECAAGQPRVMPGGDGSGALGLNIWEARTNELLRSQEFENATFTYAQGGGPGLPVATANFATAPDGTLTADRIQFPSTTATTQFSYLSGLGASSNIIYSAAVYIKGNAGTSGVVDFWLYSGTVWTGLTAGNCSFNGSTWTRCRAENIQVNTFATAQWALGQLSSVTNISNSAIDVLVWQGDLQAGATIGPPIKTAGTTATRVAELADVAFTFGSGTTGFSSASTLVQLSRYTGQFPTGATPGSLAPGNATGSTSYSEAYIDNTPVIRVDVNPASTPTTFSPGTLAVSGTINRIAVFNTGALLNACLNGTCETGIAATWTAPSWLRVRVGNYDSTNNFTNGTVKLVCLDSLSGRCR